MLSLAASRSQRLALARPARPATRVSRQLVVRSAKKKDDDLEEAYMEQLAYLERRRQRLISPRVPKKRGSGQAAQEAAPVVQTPPPKTKAVAEPSIQIEQDEPKKGGGNPFGFLSNLFGGK